MIKWAVKKYLIGRINGLLDVNQSNVAKTKNLLDTWIGRLERILKCFGNMLATLDDNKIDTEEVDQIVAEIETTIDEW